MRSKNILLGILAIMLVFTMTAVGCDNGSTDSKGNSPQKAIFQGIAAGSKYILTITENKSRAAYIAVTGDSYELRITKAGEADKVSKGTVSDVGAGGTLTLQPETAGSPTFSVRINGADIAAITGSITLADGTTVTAGSFEESGEPSTPTTQTFTSVEDMKTWLAAQPANTINTPYTVKLNVADLTGIVNALHTNNTKFVSLDLSGSTFTTIMDNAFYEAEAEVEINTLVSIIIPNSVTSKRCKSTKYNPSNQIMPQNDQFVKFFYKKSVFLANNFIFNSDPKKTTKKIIRDYLKKENNVI